MVREFQKHTDGSPIPRSDIGDRARQVDSRAVSFAARRRTLPVAANTAGFLLSLSRVHLARKCHWPYKRDEKLSSFEKDFWKWIFSRILSEKKR